MSSPHLACLALMAVHMMLSVVYSLNTPLWESFDEPGHYSYARYIALNGGLPPVGAKLSMRDESHQPPLYYWFAAWVMSGVDVSDNSQPRFNPEGWRRILVYDSWLDQFPYQRTGLAMRLGRLASVPFTTLGVWFTYLAAIRLLPGRSRLALLAASFYALWPMLLFLSGVITNDTAIAFFGALTLLLVAGLVHKRPGQARAAQYIALAVCLGGAVLAKDNALSLLLFSAIALAVIAARDVRARQWRGLAKLGLAVGLLLILLICGAIVSDGRSVRQFALLTSVANKILAPGSTATSGVPAQPLPELQHATRLIDFPLSEYRRALFDNTFGAFGYVGKVLMPTSWYTIAMVCSAVAAWGLVLAWRKRKLRLAVTICGTMFICVVAGPVVRTILQPDINALFGRFFMPGLGALTILLAIGLDSLPGILRRAGAGFAMGGIGLVALMSPFVVLWNTYQKPLFVMDVTSFDHPISFSASITYREAGRDIIRLIGYNFPCSASLECGMCITPFWLSVGKTGRDYTLRIDAFDLNGNSLGSYVEATPGRGIFPTSSWTPEDLFSDDYWLPVWPHVDRPLAAAFRISWFDPHSGQELQAICSDGKPCDPKVNALPVRLSERQTLQWNGKPALFRLGEGIELVKASLPETVRAGQPIDVPLVWRAITGSLPPQIVFVHLLSSDGRLVAQTDQAPRGGLYPTNYWAQGEYVQDTIQVHTPADLPEGAYTVRIGMYDPATLQRLPAYTPDNRRVSDDIMDAGTITVTR